jgi:hypothetical protein
MPIAQINEYNGAAATESSNISLVHMISADVSQGLPKDYPISRAAYASKTYSYEKWLKLVFTDLQSYTSVDTLKMWISSGAIGSNDGLDTSATTSSYSEPTYATPVNTDSSEATNSVPTTDPGGANIGIGGSLGGSITDLSVDDRSDYVVLQLTVDDLTFTGRGYTLSFGWTENL